MSNKYFLKDFLIASPYSMDTNFEEELTEDLFYKNYFIRSSSYKKLNEAMDSALTQILNYYQKVYFYMDLVARVKQLILDGMPKIIFTIIIKYFLI